MVGDNMHPPTPLLRQYFTAALSELELPLYASIIDNFGLQVSWD